MVDCAAHASSQFLDPLASSLRSLGLVVAPHHLSDRPGSLYIGQRLCLRDSEIIYRQPESGLLLIILYRRLGKRRSTLANPFADLFWFLRFCVEPRFCLERILCYVSTHRYRGQNEMGDARMERLCRHVLGADWTIYDDNPWLCQEAGILRSRLERMRHRFEPANRHLLGASRS